MWQQAAVWCRNLDKERERKGRVWVTDKTNKVGYLAIAEQKWKKWRQILSCNFIDFLLLYLNKKRK